MNTKNNHEYTIRRYADGSVCYASETHDLWNIHKSLIDCSYENTCQLNITRQKEYKRKNKSVKSFEIKDTITSTFNKNQTYYTYQEDIDAILESEGSTNKYGYCDPEDYPIDVKTITEYHDVPAGFIVYNGIAYRPFTHMTTGLINEGFLELTNRQMDRFPKFDTGEYSYINDINHLNLVAESTGEVYVTTSASFLKYNYTTLRKEVYIKGEKAKVSDYHKFKQMLGAEDAEVVADLIYKHSAYIATILEKANLPEYNRPVVYKVSLDYFDNKYRPYKNIYSESRRDARFYKKNARHISISVGYYDIDNIARKFIGDLGRYDVVNKNLLTIHLFRSGRNNKVEREELLSFYEVQNNEAEKLNKVVTIAEDEISKSVSPEFREAFNDISEKLLVIINKLNNIEEYLSIYQCYSNS